MDRTIQTRSLCNRWLVSAAAQAASSIASFLRMTYYSRRL
jgi:hypothetical protein